jgi:hypothetical protein
MGTEGGPLPAGSRPSENGALPTKQAPIDIMEKLGQWPRTHARLSSAAASNAEIKPQFHIALVISRHRLASPDSVAMPIENPLNLSQFD